MDQIRCYALADVSYLHEVQQLKGISFQEPGFIYFPPAITEAGILTCQFFDMWMKAFKTKSLYLITNYLDSEVKVLSETIGSYFSTVAHNRTPGIQVAIEIDLQLFIKIVLELTMINCCSNYKVFTNNDAVAAAIFILLNPLTSLYFCNSKISL